MTVNDYIRKLNDTLTLASKLCALGEQRPDGKTGDCISCPMRKAEGKSCPVCQMIDAFIANQRLNDKYKALRNQKQITEV